MPDSTTVAIVSTCLCVGACMTMMILQHREWLVSIVMGNTLLQAILVPSFLGAVMFIGGFLIQTIQKKVASQLYCSITVNNKDDNYLLVLNYLSKHCLQQDSASMSATTKNVEKSMKYWKNYHHGIRQSPEMEFRPAEDNSLSRFQFKGQTILMMRKKGETVVTGWERKPVVMESISLSCWGRSNSLLKEIVNDAIKAEFEESKDLLPIYVFSDSWGGSWEKALAKKPRSADSVILDSDLQDNLINDARLFMSEEQAKWYGSLGIPYRRGYLLHGPPGCGKTTFCQVLAGALDVGICMLNLSDKSLDDNKLAMALREAPARAMIVLEDIDAVFVERAAAADTPACSVTFSGLLNALDGVASQEGRILFMTTNHLDRLDPALIRPGRCDVKAKIRRASRYQQRRLFQRFFPGEEELAEAFSQKLPEHTLSMAQLQGFLLEHKGNAQKAVHSVTKLLQSTQPKQIKESTIYEVLRRVNLQNLTPFFEEYGYFTLSKAKILTAAAMANWSLELKYRTADLNLLQKVFEDSSKVSGYNTADVAMIRDCFKVAYAGYFFRYKNDCKEQPGDRDDELPAPPGLERQVSEGLYDECSGGSTAEVTHRTQLENELVAKLSKHGKSQISVLQLYKLFHLYPHDPNAAIRNSYTLTAPTFQSWRATGQRDAFKEMTVFQFLCRCNLTQYTCNLEGDGVTRGARLIGMSVDDLEAKGLEPEHARLVAAVVTNDAKDTVLTDGFRIPERDMLCREIRQSLRALRGEGKKVNDQMEALLDRLTDELGYGKSSLFQVRAFLQAQLRSLKTLQKDDSKEGFLSLSAANLDSLLNPTKPVPVEPEPVPEPTEWVHHWLKENKLEEYSPKFIDAGLCTEEQLCMPPLVSNGELKGELGVGCLGHRKKLMLLVEALAKKKRTGISKHASNP